MTGEDDKADSGKPLSDAPLDRIVDQKLREAGRRRMLLAKLDAWLNRTDAARVIGWLVAWAGIVLLGLSLVHPTETPPRADTPLDWALLGAGLLVVGFGLRVASRSLFESVLFGSWGRLLIIPIFLVAVGVAAFIVRFVLHEP